MPCFVFKEMPVSPPSKQRLMNVLRWGISAAVLVALVRWVGLDDLVAHFRKLETDLIALVFALLVGEALVRCLNWQQLNRAAGSPTTFRDVVYGYFTGGFFASLLPSTLGADAARAAFVARRSGSPVETLLATTVSLNLISLFVLSVLALAGGTYLLIRHEHLSSVSLLSLAMGAGVTAIAGMTIFLVIRGAAKRNARNAEREVEDFHGVQGLLRRVTGRFTSALLLTGAGPKEFARVGITAMATCALRTTGWQILLLADGVYVPWAALLVLGPALTIFAALPISVGGFGGLQAVSVFLLVDWGVSPEQAVTWSLMQSGLYVVLNSLGSVTYAAGASRRRPVVSDP
jgi:uncharacterized protein (TIRG00374 family)